MSEYDDINKLNALKENIEESDKIINNLYQSKLAKEILLKDDEKTPKVMTERILDELTENLKLYKVSLKYGKENVPSGKLSETENQKLSDNIVNINNIFNLEKEEILSSFELYPFSQLEIKDIKGNLEIHFQVKPKSISNDNDIIYITLVDIEGGKTKEYSNKEKGFGSPIPLYSVNKGSYIITVFTRNGAKYKLKYPN